jgi:hypothetical protein
MKAITILALFALAASAAQPETPGVKGIAAALLPVPHSITPGTGTLTLTRETSIKIASPCAEVGAHFAARLRRGTGWPVLVADPATITLDLVPGQAGASLEAHTLEGDCAAIVQHIPALPADVYSKQCSPESGANRTMQSPPLR